MTPSPLLRRQRKVAPNKNVNVHDFRISWKDGLAFCALIHRHRRRLDLIDYINLSKDNPLQDLNLAFDIAEKYLDTPRMLHTEEIEANERPDERSIITYMSSYYHYFTHAQEAESAAQHIGRALKGRQGIEGFGNEYDRLASDLLGWIQRTTPWLENRTTDNTLPGVRKKLDEFRTYRTQAKPPRVGQKGELETAFNTLQTKLRLQNRPPYMPREGRMVSDIANAWKNLENAERGFEDWLLSKMMRLERLDCLAQKFMPKADIHEEWSKGKEELLSRSDYRNASLAEVRALKRKHEAFESDLAVHQERVEQIAAIAEELNKLGYHDSPAMNQRCQRICGQWDRIGGLTVQRRQGIDEVVTILERVDTLHLDFAKRVSPFNNWLDGAREDLVDMFIVHTIDATQGLISYHQTFKTTLGEADKDFRTLLGLFQYVQRLAQQHNIPGALENPYINMSAEEVTNKWNEVRQLVPRRDHALQQEMMEQQQNERIRRQFAEKGNVVGPWIEKNLDIVASIGMGVHNSLEEALGKLWACRTAVQQFRPHIDELEQYHQAEQKAIILENKYTKYTIETLRARWESC